MKKINLISGLLILTIIGSCQYDPFAHKYTTKKPKEKELDGRYIFEKQTVNLEIKEFIDTLTNRQVNPIIEINSDGTYRVINLPVFESYSSNFTGLIPNEYQIQENGT